MNASIARPPAREVEMMYVVFITSNDGNEARLFETLGDAKTWATLYMAEPDNAGALTSNELTAFVAEVAGLTGDTIEGIRGRDAWKEWLYIGPISPA